MAWTRHDVRWMVCGAVSAAAAAVLCLYHPSAWGRYVAWSVSRIGVPLFSLCVGVTVAGLGLALFSRYRRKPELLAAALALSAALHLVLMAVLSLWDVGTQRPQRVGADARFEIALRLPSVTEESIAQQMRQDLLKPLLRDEKKLEPRKEADAKVMEPVEAPPLPELEALVRDPSALDAPSPVSVAQPRVQVEAVAASRAATEAQAEPDQVLKVNRIDTPAEPETAVRTEPRALEASRPDVSVLEQPPDAQRPEPTRVDPDRGERQETDEIEVKHAAAAGPGSARAVAEVTLAMVTLDLEAEQAPAPLASAESGGKMKARAELAVAAQRANAETPLRRVETPAAPTQAGAAAPRSISPDLPEQPRREAPGLPQNLTAAAQPALADVLKLVDRATLAEGGPVAVEKPGAGLAAAEIAPAPRANVSLRTGVLPALARRPELVTGAVAAADRSGVGAPPIEFVGREREAPRVAESALAMEPRRMEAGIEARPAPLMNMVPSSSRPAELSGPASAPREVSAGRPDIDVFREREWAKRPAVARGAQAGRGLPQAVSPTLVREQPHVESRVAAGVAGPEGPVLAGEGVLVGDRPVGIVQGRQALVAVAIPDGGGTDGAGARVAAPVELGRRGGMPAAGSVADVRPAAPLLQVQEAGSAVGTMAGAALPLGGMGQAGPAAPQPAAAASTGPPDVVQERMVAGRVDGVASEAAEDSGARAVVRGPSVGGAALAAPRAAPVGMAEAVTGVDRPTVTMGRVGDRGGRMVADAPGAVTVARVRGPAEPGLPGRAGDAVEGEALALPLAAVAVASEATGEAEAAARPHVAAFSPVRKAVGGADDETSASAAPLLGWMAPALPAGRGSAVRLSLDGVALGERSVGAGVTGDASAGATARVRHLMADDVVRVTAASSRKAIYELRSPEKRKFIEELGGSPETEEAVEQALAWLAKSQSDDGRWDVDGFKGVEACGGAGDRVDGDVAVTGLSLLAYLGAGYTHMAGKHRDTVRKGLEWLIEGQDRDGDLRRGGTLYDQAMAAAALCESSSLTGDERLAAPARLAAEFIMAAQNPGAGWRYQPRTDNDTSVLGWQVLALKSAEISGIRIPPRHFAWTGQWLDQVRKGKGGLYAYKPGHGPTPVMTAEGWFCQLFMGEKSRMQGQEESVAYLLENLPEWRLDNRGMIHLYYWYYATLALRLSGAPEFERWNTALKAALLEGRCREGAASGSWDPVCQLGPRGGRVYSTAMAALCLEVYYRYLPFYRRLSREP